VGVALNPASLTPTLNLLPQIPASRQGEVQWEEIWVPLLAGKPGSDNLLHLRAEAGQ
jgi:hypothetical protein